MMATVSVMAVNAFGIFKHQLFKYHPIRWLGIFLCIVLTSCAGSPTKSPNASAEYMPNLRLSPASFGQSLTLLQRLTAQPLNVHDIDTARQSDLGATTMQARQSLEAVLQIDAEQVQLVGLALGQRVLTLSFDGNTLNEQRHPLMPAAVNGERILRDVQLVYWPAAAIRAELPPEWTLIETPLRRVLMKNDVLAVEIIYSADPAWAGRVEFLNQRQHYQLLIESVVQ